MLNRFIISLGQTWPALLLMAAIFILSSVPGRDSGGPTWIGLVSPEVNNLLHIPVYGLLTFLWFRALTTRGHQVQRAYWIAAIISVFWGLLDELHQLLVPGRYGSLTDMLLNSAGAIICIFFIRIRNSVLFNSE